MTASAYHLFYDIYQRRGNLRSNALDVERLALRDDLIACRGVGKFPDLVLRTNPQNPMFPGGEFVEIKDSRGTYSIASFNSTVPSAIKNIRVHISPTSNYYGEIEANDGRSPYDLEEREVYYLVRGCRNTNYKVCLVHGAFFETLGARENIRSALGDSFAHAIEDSGLSNNSRAQRAAREMLDLEWEQHHLSKTRKNEDASVSIRMRVMSEVVSDANILNPKKYPQIEDDTLSMAVPAIPHDDYAQAESNAINKMRTAFDCASTSLPADLSVEKLMHLKNGAFVLFKTGL